MPSFPILLYLPSTGLRQFILNYFTREHHSKSKVTRESYREKKKKKGNYIFYQILNRNYMRNVWFSYFLQKAEIWQRMTKQRRYSPPMASPVFVVFTVMQEPSVLPTSLESYGQLGSVGWVYFSTYLARNCSLHLKNTFPMKMFFQKSFIFAKMTFSSGKNINMFPNSFRDDS